MNIQGAKKMPFKPIFEFQTLGGVFLGEKNNSKNFGNKKIIRFLSKILMKLTLFSGNVQKKRVYLKTLSKQVGGCSTY